MGDASTSRVRQAGGLKNDDQHVSVIDIRREAAEYSILDEMRKMLNPTPGNEKKMPTMLLYDEQGLKLFEEITYLDEYYLTNAEIEALERHANKIAHYVQPGSQVVELGSGNLRKVKILLDAFENAQKNVDYYALDLSKPELERTLEAVKGLYQHVKCHGLFGTYDDGLAWLQQPCNVDRPKCILWLGSSIGNLDRTEAACFLRSFTSILHVSDTMLIGIDACQDADKVFHGYNDRLGKTHEFVLNGLTHANRLLGKEAFKLQDWRVIGEYDAKAGRHHAFYSPHRNVEVEGVVIRAGERVRIEESYKYSAAQSASLWQEAGLIPRERFGDASGEYNLHLVSVPSLNTSLKAREYAASVVPSLAEFEQLWLAWDVVSRCMIPPEEQLSKPINLRNCCLFYLGHIPAFLDNHLTRATGDAPTPPGHYHQMFERGIDPDVENPEHCHAHSEIPDEWPPLEEIIAYQGRVRDRARALYKSVDLVRNRNIGRAFWIGFEHEAMHLETLLYMLLQSDKTLPPPGIRPNFEALAKSAREEAIPNDWIEVPARKVNVGIDDPEKNEGPEHYFGWDNEKPERQVEVGKFEAKARPISNEEYARFLEENRKDTLPASWKYSEGPPSPHHSDSQKVQNGNGIYLNGDSPPLTDAYLNDKSVRTVYGPVPLKHALDWPVFASYDELAACAAWMGGRIPTAQEVGAIYDYVDANKVKETDSILTRKISAVNGHLSNNGIEISPPSHPCSHGATGAEHKLDPSALFTDLESCNVGFQNFHPTPVTQNGNRLAGRGETGGVWEWTSSTLERWEGFKAMELYPAYTTDFFDGKHNVVFGGSWATHPRIAGRKSFVNWYQRNYLYAWCGARVVRDVL